MKKVINKKENKKDNKKDIKKENKIETISVKCVDFTFDGQGLCKDKEGIVYFVPSLLIDEEAEIEVLYHKKDFNVGRIRKITKFSPYRIKPLCGCSTACGGCSFQNLLYEKELEYKKNTAVKTLTQIGKIKVINPTITGMEEPTYYRNKIQVPFGYDKQKRLVYGFYKMKSHDIIPITECVIEDKVHVSILQDIKKLMESMKITPYNEDIDKGTIRHILIRVGKVSGEIMLVLVTREKNFGSKANFVKELKKLHPEITTIVQNVNERRTNVILGEKEEVLYGKGFIYDSLLGVNFKISSKSFYQVNHDQCEKLYSLALTKAGLTKEDEIVDLYCGIGTISLIASKYVKNVVGVEIVKEAIIDAKNNAKLNNINNANFLCDDASNFLMKKAYDCVFIDPPRKGLDPKVVKALMNSHPKKIVYISCDVGTLARDLNLLKKNYDIDSIDFVDMFPRTYHIETVAALSLKGLKESKKR